MKGGENMLTKTLKIQLYPDKNQKESLYKTQLLFTKACNYVSYYIFNHDFDLNQRHLHDCLYYQLRKDFKLQSQMAQSVIRTVISRYKTVNTTLKQKPYKFKDINTNQYHYIKRNIEWLKQPIQFKSNVAVFVRNRNYSLLKNGQYSISTVDGRLKIDCDSNQLDYIQQFNDWKHGEAELLQRRGQWFLYISVSKDIDSVKKQSIQHVVGIDRGLRQIMTTYNEKDQTQFFNGQNVLKRRRHFKKLRQQLQSKNTKSSKRRLRKIEQRENRWMSDVNHQLSKTLIDQFGEHTLFVLEDLANVTFDTVNQRYKNNRYEHVSWSFFDLEQKLIYKSLESKCMVVKVDAHYTSQRCPKCGCIDKDNRNKSNHLFECVQCRYKSNDDRVAAMNIQELGKQYISGVDKPHFEKLEPKLEY